MKSHRFFLSLIFSTLTVFSPFFAQAQLGGFFKKLADNVNIEIKTDDSTNTIANSSQNNQPQTLKQAEQATNSATQEKANIQGQQQNIIQNYYLEYKSKAEKGEAESQFNLGRCYSRGEGVAKDDVEAVKWFRMSAEQGYAKGQNGLGVCYANGLGVAKDEVEAVNWYRKAADQGDAKAQFNLGACYGNGLGVSRDEVKAVEWFRKAADQGFAEGQYLMGVCYANGEGIAKDDMEAMKWYRKAAEQGHPQAKEAAIAAAQVKAEADAQAKEAAIIAAQVRAEADAQAKEAAIAAVQAKAEADARVKLQAEYAKQQKQKADDEEAQAKVDLAIQQAAIQQAAAQRAAEKKHDELVAIIFVVVCVIFLITAIVGTYMGLKDKLVVFWGKRDAIVSLVIGVTLICLFGSALFYGDVNSPASKGHFWESFFIILILISYSTRRAFLANNRNIPKTILAVLTKVTISFFALIAAFLTWNQKEEASNSEAKANKIVADTQEKLSEKLMHQKNAASYLATAGFWGSITAGLVFLITKLVKKNPAQTFEEPNK